VHVEVSEMKGWKESFHLRETNTICSQQGIWVMCSMVLLSSDMYTKLQICIEINNSMNITLRPMCGAPNIYVRVTAMRLVTDWQGGEECRDGGDVVSCHHSRIADHVQDRSSS
jgi:hypothetical protein